MHNPQLRRRLHRINVPTLMLRGASDGLVSAEYARAYAKSIPGARLETIERAGHVIQLEQPQELADRIVRFIAER
jgi:pimeloyl-ACP methyl ester carboxylesterase